MELKDYSESPLSDEEQQLVSSAIQQLKILLQEQGIDAEGNITPENLNKIYPFLKKGTFWSKKRKNIAVVLLGAGLGECFVTQLNFKWVLIKDRLGEEISVKHDSGKWVCFPFSSVRKRIGTREKDFFTVIFDYFSKEVNAIN